MSMSQVYSSISLCRMINALGGGLTTLVDEVHVSRLESSECLSSLQTAEDASRRLQQQAAENERAMAERLEP